MARTLATVNAEIAKLQQEADRLQANEAADVVAKIRQAIEHYGLTAQDLGFSANGRSAEPNRPARAVAKPARKRVTSKRKLVGVVRFRDGAGNTWTGHGKRPNWYKAAIEAGKTPEELAVK